MPPCIIYYYITLSLISMCDGPVICGIQQEARRHCCNIIVQLFNYKIKAGYLLIWYGCIRCIWYLSNMDDSQL